MKQAWLLLLLVCIVHVGADKARASQALASKHSLASNSALHLSELDSGKVSSVLAELTAGDLSEAAGDTTEFLGALFKDPAAVADSNPLLAPDRTARRVYTRIEAARDAFMQMHGELKEVGMSDDCNAVHRIATRVVATHRVYKSIEKQLPRLTVIEQQAVAAYLQKRLSPISHKVSQEVVKVMLICEQSTEAYANAVAGIKLITRRVNQLRHTLRLYETDCIKMQSLFHEFSTVIEDFHLRTARHMAQMRQDNMISAVDRASMEISARMAPVEREFTAVYHALWQRNCRVSVDATFGIVYPPPPTHRAKVYSFAPAQEDVTDRAAGKIVKQALAPARLVSESGVLRQKLFAFSQLDDVVATVVIPVTTGAGSGANATDAASSNTTTATPTVPTTDATTISFPASYPHTARLLLFVAMVGMFLCAAIFLAMGFGQSESSLHKVVFMLTMVGACSYLALYSGIGVAIERGPAPHVVLWARHVDLLITLPLSSLAISLFGRTAPASAVAMMGSSFLMAASWAISASSSGAVKYSWWVISVIFFFFTAAQWFNQISQSRLRLTDATTETLTQLTGLVGSVWVVYLIINLLASEGMNLVSFTTEVGLYVFADFVGKLGFGFFVLTSYDETAMMSGEHGQLLPSSRYV